MSVIAATADDILLAAGISPFDPDQTLHHLLRNEIASSSVPYLHRRDTNLPTSWGLERPRKGDWDEANLFPRSSLATVVLPHFAAAQTAPAISSITTPDKVETRLGTLHFKDGAPGKATLEKAYRRGSATSYAEHCSNLSVINISAKKSEP